MTDEDQSDSSVVHVHPQSCSSVDRMTSESSGYQSSIQRSPLSAPNTPGEGSSNGVVFVNQTEDFQDIEDNVFIDTAPTKTNPPSRSVAARQEVSM